MIIKDLIWTKKYYKGEGNLYLEYKDFKKIYSRGHEPFDIYVVDGNMLIVTKYKTDIKKYIETCEFKEFNEEYLFFGDIDLKRVKIKLLEDTETDDLSKKEYRFKFVVKNGRNISRELSYN